MFGFITVTLEEFLQVLQTQGGFNDVVTIEDDEALMESLSVEAYRQLECGNVFFVGTFQHKLAMTAAKADAIVFLVTIAPDTVGILADTGAVIGALTPQQFADISNGGFSEISPTDGVLTLDLAQYSAFDYALIDPSATFTLADTAAALQSLTPDTLALFAANNVDFLHATDGGVNLTVAQSSALGTVAFTPGDTVSLADSGAAIASLSADVIAALTAHGIDLVDATDGAITLSLAQAEALAATSAEIAASDTVTVTGTAEDFFSLSPSALESLGEKGAGRIVLAPSDGALTLSVAQCDAIAAGSIAIAPGTAVTISDSAAHLRALTPAEIADLPQGATIHAFEPQTLVLDLAQIDASTARGIALVPTDSIMLADVAANFAALTPSQISGYAADGVDQFLAYGPLTLTAAQATALLATSAGFTSSDITLRDAGTAIAALSPAQFAMLAAADVQTIDAADGELSLTVAQWASLDGVAIAPGATVTLLDTPENVGSLSASQIAQLWFTGVLTIKSSTGALALSLAQFGNLGPVTLTPGDTVVLTDTGAALTALTPAALSSLAAAGIDGLDANDGALTLDIAQYENLDGLVLAPGNLVTLRDKGAALGALSVDVLHGLTATGVDRIDASDNVLTLDAAQIGALGGVALARNDTVTLADTGANLHGHVDFATLAAIGIDVVHATDGVLDLYAQEYLSLGHVALTASDDVTIQDAGLAISRLSAATLAGLAAHGIDAIDAFGPVIFSIAQYGAVADISLSGIETLTVEGTHRADTFMVRAGTVNLDGEGGYDTADYAGVGSAVHARLDIGRADGAVANLLNGIENLTGSNFNDVLIGDSGRNALDGGAGSDKLIGGAGPDVLTGGAGADRFVYQNAADSTYGAIDTITDFSHAEHDRINLAAIDAVPGGADDAFTLVARFTHHAGQLEIVNVGQDLYQVRADIDGDGKADFAIVVQSATAPVAQDFLL